MCSHQNYRMTVSEGLLQYLRQRNSSGLRGGLHQCDRDYRDNLLSLLCKTLSSNILLSYNLLNHNNHNSQKSKWTMPRNASKAKSRYDR